MVCKSEHFSAYRRVSARRTTLAASARSTRWITSRSTRASRKTWPNSSPISSRKWKKWVPYWRYVAVQNASCWKCHIVHPCITEKLGVVYERLHKHKIVNNGTIWTGQHRYRIVYVCCCCCCSVWWRICSAAFRRTTSCLWIVRTSAEQRKTSTQSGAKWQTWGISW